MPAIAIENLRRRVSILERDEALSDGAGDGAGFSTGSNDMDALLPSGRLATGALHELQCASYRDRAATLGAGLGFCARLLETKPGPLIWCQLRDTERLHLHGPGLAGFGIDPARITKITLRNEQDMLWAMEEALQCGYVAGVVGVFWTERLYDFKASRRLNLRARKSGVTALLVRSHWANGTTAAETRWLVSSRESRSLIESRSFLPPVGKPHWQLEMTRCRGAKPETVKMEWDREALRFNLASRLVAGAHRPPKLAPVGLPKTG